MVVSGVGGQKTTDCRVRVKPWWEIPQKKKASDRCDRMGKKGEAVSRARATLRKDASAGLLLKSERVHGRDQQRSDASKSELDRAVREGKGASCKIGGINERLEKARISVNHV